VSYYIDIETRPQSREAILKVAPVFTAPANWKDEAKIAAKIAEQQDAFIEKAALSPLTGTVQAFGIYCDEDDAYITVDESEFTEEAMLELFWDTVTSHRAFMTEIYGWNLNGFDIPFLIKRSWSVGVKVPRSALEWYRGRSYLNQQFKDLMQYFCLSPDERYMKLDAALALLGLPRKVDLSGKLPYDIFESDPALFHEYLKADVMGLHKIAEAVGA